MAEDLFPFDSDDDDVDEPDEGDKVTKGDDNKSFADLRKYAKKLERESKTQAQELEDLRTFKSGVVEVQTQAAISSIFTEVGLAPEHGALFKAMNAEVTPDAITKDVVAAFAAQYKLPTVSGDQVEAPEPQPQGFTPVTTGTAAPSGKLTTEDINQMLKDGDFEGVTNAFANGRVQKESVPWVELPT